MLSLVLLVLVIFVALTVLLSVGTFFIQGYFYTEPGGEIAWRAPAAAGALAFFYLLWGLLDARTQGFSPQDIPYDTLFNFNRWTEMTSQPVGQLWAVKKNSPNLVPYALAKYVQAGRAYTTYKRVGTGDNWTSVGVEAIEIEDTNHQKIRFVRRPGENGRAPEWVSDSGWVMDETADLTPTGIPKRAPAGRLLANVLLNLFHLGLWFVCLWLVLRFQWSHALSLAAVLWLVATLTTLPPLLRVAAAAAWPQPATSPAAAAPATPPPAGLSCCFDLGPSERERFA